LLLCKTAMEAAHCRAAHCSSIASGLAVGLCIVPGNSRRLHYMQLQWNGTRLATASQNITSHPTLALCAGEHRKHRRGHTSTKTHLADNFNW